MHVRDYKKLLKKLLFFFYIKFVKKICFRTILYLILNILSFLLSGTMATIIFGMTVTFWAFSYDFSGKLELGDAVFLGKRNYIPKIKKYTYT